MRLAGEGLLPFLTGAAAGEADLSLMALSFFFTSGESDLALEDLCRLLPPLSSSGVCDRLLLGLSRGLSRGGEGLRFSGEPDLALTGDDFLGDAEGEGLADTFLLGGDADLFLGLSDLAGDADGRVGLAVLRLGEGDRLAGEGDLRFLPGLGLRVLSLRRSLDLDL